MSFFISKIVWFILSPFNFLIVILLSGVILWSKFPRYARIAVTTATLLLFTFSLPYFPRLCVRQLEHAVTPAKITNDIAGVIVLGGMIDINACRQGRIELLSSADRIIDAIILLRKYNQAKLVITGGSGSLDQGRDLREAVYLRRLAQELGVDDKRIVIETNSRATYEHPKFLEKMIDKKQKWVLVTSASHMPRALGCFKKYGFNVLPYPVDFQGYSAIRSDGLYYADFIPSVDNLFVMDNVVHEWYGWLYYRLMGYIAW
jgi:uncharacterized SAM-binding protein YcdF (DUF218 family)